MAGKDKSHKKILLLSSLFLSFLALFATAVLVCLVLRLNKRLIENESAVQSIRDEINSYKKTQDGLDMLKTIRQTVDENSKETASGIFRRSIKSNKKDSKLVIVLRNLLEVYSQEYAKLDKHCVSNRSVICVQGQKGDKGKAGPRGLKGDPGPVGPMGETGLRGTTGLRGVKGKKGDNGIKGERGLPGRSISKARITEKPENSRIKMGQPATFTCEAEGNPKPEINWFLKNGTDNTKYKIIDKTALIIENIGPSDDGEIKCEAKNVFGKDTAIAILTVLVPPRVKIKPDVLTTYEGRDETITCNVSGNPKPIITWEKLNSDLPSSSSVNGNGQLKLRDLSRDNSGIYRCTGRNSLGSEAATVVLAVRPCQNFAYPCINQGVCFSTKTRLIPEIDRWFMLHCKAAQCGNGDGKSGELKSPNYPSEYEDNTECAWIIKVPKGKRVRLNFADFETEGVRFDPVTLWNGFESENEIAKLGGTTGKDKVYHSSENIMLVKFKSDGSNTKKGFIATWSAED